MTVFICWTKQLRNCRRKKEWNERKQYKNVLNYAKIFKTRHWSTHSAWVRTKSRLNDVLAFIDAILGIFFRKSKSPRFTLKLKKTQRGKYFFHFPKNYIFALTDEFSLSSHIFQFCLCVDVQTFFLLPLTFSAFSRLLSFISTNLLP